jgi:hypothetical protein
MVEPGSPTVARPGAKPLSAEYRRSTARFGFDAHEATKVSQFNTLHRSDGPGWLSSDGTKSVRLPDGRVMWAYGDTLIGTAKDGKVTKLDGFLRNSIVVQNGTMRTTLYKNDSRGKPHAAIPSPHPNEWYWLGQPIVDKDTVKIIAGRVAKTDGPHGWNFKGVGTDIVTLNADDLSLRSYDKLSRLPGSWGGNTFRDGDHIYFTGNRKGKEWAPDMLLGRAPSGNFNSRHLEFWDGKKWVEGSQNAKPITSGTEGTFHKIDGGYALVTQGYPFGTDLFVQNARKLTGPWTEPRKLASLPKLPPASITYGAMGHDAFASDGKILISYNVNRSDAGLPGELKEYRPGFIAVDEDKLRPKKWPR